MRYICLLRGINVGGNNIIKMQDLRDCLMDSGFENVGTYIQSGNIVFDAPKQTTSKLTDRIAKVIKQQFDLEPSVLVISKDILVKIVEQAPSGFGSQPEEYKYDVIFLFPDISPEEVLDQIETNEEVDQVSAGKLAIYYSRLSSKLTKSRLSKIVSKSIYKKLTIRNWRTTSKLLEMTN